MKSLRHAHPFSLVSRSRAELRELRRRVEGNVDLKQFEEMAVRKVFRDFDDQNVGYLDSVGLHTMMVEVMGSEGARQLYQAVTLTEAEKFLKGLDSDEDGVIDEKEFVQYMMDLARSAKRNAPLPANASNKEVEERQMQQKLAQFAKIIVARLEMRATALYSLFQKYSSTHYIPSRNSWASNVLDENDMLKMMCETLGEENQEKFPSPHDVSLFMRCMDKDGDNHLQVKEFMQYMLRGMVQSEKRTSALCKPQQDALAYKRLHCTGRKTHLGRREEQKCSNFFPQNEGGARGN